MSAIYRLEYRNAFKAVLNRLIVLPYNIHIEHNQNEIRGKYDDLKPICRQARNRKTETERGPLDKSSRPHSKKVCNIWV